MALPDSILDATGDWPEGRLLALAVLRERFPEMRFAGLISPSLEPPFALVREVGFEGAWDQDSRFKREFFISIETFTEGLESDVDAPKIHRAAEDAFRRAALGNRFVLDAWIVDYDLAEPPRRLYDWASATGPVQTADLPVNWMRWHSLHRIEIKRSDVGPHVYDY